MVQANTRPRMPPPEQGPAAPPLPAREKPRPTIQSVDRCFDIMEALARSPGSVSLAELSAQVGLNLSTCHHLVATICQRGYVTQERDTRRYALSSKIFELSEARTRQIDLVRLAMPHLDRLNRATGEAVVLAVLEGTDLMTVARLNSAHAVRVENAASRAHAAHATADGKAILAWLPELEIDAVLAAKGMQRFTANTIGDRNTLIEALRLVRRYGYAEDREEFQPNVYAAGAAIRTHKGMVAGSLSVSLPMMRASDDTIAATRAAVMAAALAISRELGAGSTA